MEIVKSERSALEKVLPLILKYTACPRCEEVGQVEVELNPNNNGLSLRCRNCKRLFSGVGPFVPQGKRSKRPANPIARLKREAESRCYLCGLAEDQLRAIGRKLQVHHVVPYAVSGHEGPQIPLCTLCHEIARAVQHDAGKRVVK